MDRSRIGKQLRGCSTFPFGSTNCIRFKGYFSAQGTPKVFVKVNKVLLFIYFFILVLQCLNGIALLCSHN